MPLEHPDEVADMLHMQPVWDWLYDDQGIHSQNITITQVMVNAVIKGALVTRASHVTSPLWY